MSFFTIKYGVCCGCVPAKAGISLLSVLLLVLGFGQLCYWTITLHRTIGVLKPEPRTGSHLAPSPISCLSTQRWSYVARSTGDAILATAVGLLGLLAALDNSSKKLRGVRQGAFLLLAGRLAIFIYDMGYMGFCTTYPFNIVASAALDTPLVSNDAEKRLLLWSRYPPGDTDAAAGIPVLIVYVATTVVIVLVVLYLTRVIDRATMLMASGPVGMGEFFGLRADLTDEGAFGGEPFEQHPLAKPVDVSEEYGFQLGFGFYTNPEGKFQTN